MVNGESGNRGLTIQDVQDLVAVAHLTLKAPSEYSHL
jgi:hypothetical protein